MIVRGAGFVLAIMMLAPLVAANGIDTPDISPLVCIQDSGDGLAVATGDACRVAHTRAHVGSDGIYIYNDDEKTDVKVEASGLPLGVLP